MSTIRPSLARLTGALALAAVATSALTTGAATAAAAKRPSKIRIAYQAIPNGDLIVKNQRYLEKAFGSKVKIEWKQFDSGGSVNEAIVAGSIDIGLVGSSPTSRGVSNGIAYRVPFIFDVIGKAEALVARTDKGITTIADLKGKKVATPFASTAHYSLLAALQDAGLSDKDVQVIDAEPADIAAAWTRGDIDAAYVWNPTQATLVADKGKVLISSEDLSKKGKTTYDLAVVTDAFATKYPGAVRTWLEQQDKAVKLYRSNPAKASKAVAAELNIEPAAALAQMKELVLLTAKEQAAAEYLGGGLAKNLYAAAVFNKGLGKIPAVKDEAAYQTAVDAKTAAAVGRAKG